MGKEPSTFAQLDFTNIKQLSRFLHTEEILSSILKFNIKCKHFFCGYILEFSCGRTDVKYRILRAVCLVR